MEEVFLEGVAGNCPNEDNSEEVPFLNLRSRTVTKQSKNTSKRSGTKKAKLKTKKEHQTDYSSSHSTAENPPGLSQESVSMLDDCFGKTAADDFPELMDTGLEPDLDMISIYEEDSTEAPASTCAEKSTLKSIQIETADRRELEMSKHAEFISSVVKLKAFLSSEKTVSDRNLWRILNRDTEGEISDDCTVPKETIDYVFRSSDVDAVFHGTVEALIKYLEEGLRENFSKMAYFWKNSVYEAAVEMLTEAVESDFGAQKIVQAFLFRIIESILKNEDKLNNLMLESKSMFVLSFCQSAHLSFPAINHTVEKLRILLTVGCDVENVSMKERISESRTVKNSYFLLRMLEMLLDSFRAKIEDGKIEDVLARKPEVKTFNVLEMWKKHWNREEVREEQKPGHGWEIIMSKWCEDLDEISVHCVSHIPVLSMAVGRCGEMAKEVLKVCHPEINKMRERLPTDGDKCEGEVEEEMDFCSF